MGALPSYRSPSLRSSPRCTALGGILGRGLAAGEDLPGRAYPRLMFIATERLILRRFRAPDAPVLAEYRSDPEVARYQSWDAPFPLLRAETAVANFMASDPDKAGWFQYAVERV